jgi:hypothetical protein
MSMKPGPDEKNKPSPGRQAFIFLLVINALLILKILHGHLASPGDSRQSREVSGDFVAAMLRGDTARMAALCTPGMKGLLKDLRPIDPSGSITPQDLEKVLSYGAENYSVLTYDIDKGSLNKELNVYLSLTHRGWKVYRIRVEDFASPQESYSVPPIKMSVSDGTGPGPAPSP